MFHPQQAALPSVLSTQLYALPEASAVTPDSPATVTGVVLSAAVPAPSPSWPQLFDPQQATPPSDLSAQL